jgi:hypothetical protein
VVNLPRNSTNAESRTATSGVINNNPQIMETKEVSVPQISYDIIESLIINGDLSKLDQKQKVEYYNKYCAALGLNPVTQPFSLLKLNGKEKLYCGREGTAQLSKVHEVSHEISSKETVNGVYIVTAKAITGSRYTTSTGAVSIEGLKGDALCNALMKAETKAKRRATLDLLGLGMLDDSEVNTIPGATTEDISHTVPTEQELIEDACLVLQRSTTADELKNAWSLIGREMQSHNDCIKVKEEMKQKLTPVQA